MAIRTLRHLTFPGCQAIHTENIVTQFPSATSFFHLKTLKTQFHIFRHQVSGSLQATGPVMS